MRTKIFSLLLALLLPALLVGAADAQFWGGKGNQPNGDFGENSPKWLTFSSAGTPTQLDTIIYTTPDTSIAPFINIWGADAIGLMVQTVDINNEDDIIVKVETSFDGVTWGNLAVLDTVTAADEDMNIVVHSTNIETHGYTMAEFQGYKMMRVILTPVSTASETDSATVKVRPYVLSKQSPW